MVTQLATWVSRLGPRESLGKARQALQQSLALEVPERRSALRIPVRTYDRKRSELLATVLNLSSTGMAIQVPSECRFGTGEIHHFTLTIGVEAVEVEGRVCWTDSSWQRFPGHREQVYTQTAGFDLAESVIGHTQEIWQVLIAMVEKRPVSIKLQSFEVVQVLG